MEKNPHASKWPERMRALLIYAGLALISYYLFWPSPEEPSFGGKTVSEWLRSASNGDSHSWGEAQLAVEQMGAPAIPFLEKLVQKEDAPLKKFYIAVRDGMPATLAEQLPELKANARQIRGWAVSTLGGMEQKAVGSVELLIDIAADHQDPALRGEAVFALGKIAPGTPKRNATLKVLLNSTSDPSHAVRQKAYLSLLKFQFNPGELKPVISSFERGLKDPSTRGIVALCSRELGPAGKPLIPVLRELLKDPDRHTRRFVTNALYRIDPTSLR